MHNAMQKLGILASGLAVLVGLWVTWTKVATAQVHSNAPKIAMVDNCDPATFNAAIGPGTCAPTPHKLDTTFADFVGLLFSPLAANVIGHPAWQFAPGLISVSAGQTVRVTNAGGEDHTFTEVTDFGGGFVPLLNGVGGPTGTVPLVQAGACLASPEIVGPGSTAEITGLDPWGAQIPVLYPPLDARSSGCRVETLGPESRRKYRGPLCGYELRRSKPHANRRPRRKP